MKGLLIGAGSIGRRHLMNIQSLGYRDIIAYRSQRTGSETLEAEYQIRSTYDLHQALNESIEFVVIANPTSLHIPVAIKCAERGCHLYIEKPLTDRDEDVDALARVVRENSVKVMVGYNLRFHPVLQRVRMLLDKKVVGRILSARAWVGQYLPDWHPGEDYHNNYVARSELGGGVIHTLSHELDYLYWLFGRIRDVTAVTAQPDDLQMDTESIAEIILRFQSGVVGQVHLDCMRRVPSRGLEIVGQGGTISCDIIRGEICIDRPQQDKEILQLDISDENLMYREAMKHFLLCVSSGQDSCIPLQDGIAVLNLALAAHRAANRGVRQECP